MDYPLVSIVTPSYNQAQFIEETLLSVKGQDYPNLEHIVIDGGSTDGTVDILRRYEDEYNLRWISEPDEGQSDAINKGFRMARGEIIGWVNSDDTYMPGTLHKVVAYLSDHPDTDWVYGDGYTIDSDSYVLSVWKAHPFDLKALLCEGQFICQPAAFYRRSAIETVGLLDQTLHFTMDYDFFIRLGSQCQAAYLPELLATRRLTSEAKSLAQSERFLSDWIATLDKAFETLGPLSGINNFRHQAYANAHYHGGIRYFDLRDFRSASRHLWRSWKLDHRLILRRNLVIFLLLVQCLLRMRLIMPTTYHQILDKGRNADSKSVAWSSSDVSSKA